jgi:hypothetical protein
MTDWDQLREIGHQASPPPFDSLVRTAHQRDRRRRVVTGAATVALVTALGIGAWLANGNGGGNPQPIDDPSESPAPSQVALPESVHALPTPDANDESITTEPGRYRIALSDTLAFDVELPIETNANNEGLYLAYRSTILKVETADGDYGVSPDACRSFNVIDPAGPAVDDLVSAIRSEPIYSVSQPEPVEIDGARGQYFVLRIPPNYDASRCADDQVGLPGTQESANNMEPGYLGRWWIVDVDGQRVVVQLFTAERNAPELEVMTKAVEGITFRSAS